MSDDAHAPQLDNPYHNIMVSLDLMKEAIYSVLLRSPRDLDTVTLNRYTGLQLSLRDQYRYELSQWIVLAHSKNQSLSNEEQNTHWPKLVAVLGLYDQIRLQLAIQW